MVWRRSALALAFLLLAPPYAAAAEWCAGDDVNALCLGAGVEDGATLRVGDVLGVRAGVFVQGRFDAGLQGTKVSRADFSFRLVRPTLNLTLLRPWVRVNVTPEFAGLQASLWTAFLELQPYSWLGVRAGQFLTNHDRTIAVQFPLRQWTDVAPSSAAFAVPRDVGVMLFGATPGGLLDWQAGLYNGVGANRVAVGHVPSVLVGRVALNPLRRMPYTETPGVDGPVPPGFSLAAHGSVRTHNNPLAPAEPLPTDVSGGSVGMDAAFHWQHVALQWELFYRMGIPGLQGLLDFRERAPWEADASAEASGIGDRWRSTAKTHGLGGSMQASAFVVPRYLELGARLGAVSTNVATTTWNTHYDVQVGGYVLGNHLKVVARYGLTAHHRTWTTSGVEHQGVLMTQLFL